MYSLKALHETHPVGPMPFTMALARETPFDVDAILNREDGLRYDAAQQVNKIDPLSQSAMGRSTCSRRSSTGLVFTDNDRQQDD